MIKPIARFKSPEMYRYADNGNKVIFYSGIYDARTFGAVMPNIFWGGWNVRDQNVAILPYVGCGYASTLYGGNICGYTCAYYKDFYKGDWGYVLPIENDNFVVALRGTQALAAIVDSNWNTKQLPGNVNFGSYYGIHNLVRKMPNNQYVFCFVNSYYERGELFLKFNEQFNMKHGSKVISNWCIPYIHWSSDMYILASSNGFNDTGRHILYLYDFNTERVTVLTDFKGGYVRITSIPSQLIDLDEQTWIYFIIQPRAQDSLFYRAVRINKNSFSAQREDWTVDYGGNSENSVVFLRNNDRRCGIDCWVMKDDEGNHYLNVLFISRDDYHANDAYYKIITFSIDFDNRKLTYVSHYNFNQQVCSFFPLTSRFNEICVLGMSSTFFLEFNFNESKWIDYIQPFRSFYVFTDSLGRLWAIDAGHRLYPIMKTVPDSVYLKLENPYVVYSGEAVDNNILIDVYNYRGERISVEGDLVILSDNMEFPDHSKIKHVVTSKEATTVVPVKIIGGGFYSVDFRITSLAEGQGGG
jgi:hypothetical protein